MDADKSKGATRRTIEGPFMLSLTATAVLFAICLGALHPRYLINDDLKIIAILAGYPAGNPAPFPVFSNVLLGLTLVPLYRLHTIVNWEIVLFLVVDLLAISGLVYILLCGSLHGFWKMLGAGAILVVGSYFPLNITFTNAAGLACFAGLCLLLYSSRSSARTPRMSALAGIMLVFVGSIIRIQMLALSLPIIVAAAACLYRSLVIRRVLVCLSCTVVLVAAGIDFDLIYVRAHADWNTYYTYNAAAQQLQDAHRLGNAGTAIKRISWSKNDQELFARSFFPDPGTYSLKRIQYLNAHVSGTGSDMRKDVTVFLRRLIAPSGLPIVLLIGSLWLLVLAYGPSLSVVLAATFVVLTSLAENALLAWYYKNPDWSLFTLLGGTAFLLTLLPSWPIAGQGEGHGTMAGKQPRPLLWLALPITLLAIGMLIYQGIQISNQTRNRQEEYRHLLSDLDRLQREGRIAADAVIISPSHGIPWEWSNPLVLDWPRIPFLDTGYVTFSPFYEQALEEYGLQPLPRQLYAKPNVYVMTKSIFQQYLGRYYQEHEGLSVTFKPVYSLRNRYNVPEYIDTQLYQVMLVK